MLYCNEGIIVRFSVRCFFFFICFDSLRIDPTQTRCSGGYGFSRAENGRRWFSGSGLVFQPTTASNPRSNPFDLSRTDPSSSAQTAWCVCRPHFARTTSTGVWRNRNRSVCSVLLPLTALSLSVSSGRWAGTRFLRPEIPRLLFAPVSKVRGPHP